MIYAIVLLSLCLKQSIQKSTDYDYLDHGENWFQHKSYSSACFKNKKWQSPLNLGEMNTTQADESGLYLFPKYQETVVGIYKENTSLLIAPIDAAGNFGPMYTVNSLGQSAPFYGKEILFRSEAEHTIKGVRSLLEVQIGHNYMYTINANKSSLAVLFDVDDTAEPNPFLQQVIDNYDKEQFTIDLSLLVPLSVSIEPYYYYQGSLSSPPCSEKSLWIILENVRKVPKYQIDFFYNLYHKNPNFKGEGNYRNVQSPKTSAQSIQILYRANPYKSDLNPKFLFATLKAHSLPALKYDYAELKPVLSPTLLEFHHSKHHQAYINNLNAAQEQLEDALNKNDIQKIASLQQIIKFNLGGHLNHSLFWENLTPIARGGGELPAESSKLSVGIKEQWGSYDNFKTFFNTRTAAIQGSGWGFLGVDQQSKKLRYLELPNQEIPQNYGLTPILTVDVWEHAYWWDYKNARPHFLNNIWQIVNWKDVEARFNAATQ